MMERDKRLDSVTNKESNTDCTGSNENISGSTFTLSNKKFYESIKKKLLNQAGPKQTSYESDISNSKSSLCAELTEECNVNNLSNFFSKLTLTDGVKSGKSPSKDNDIDFQSLTLLESATSANRSQPSEIALTDGVKSGKSPSKDNDIDFQSLTLLESTTSANISQSSEIDIPAKGEPAPQESNSSSALPALNVNANGCCSEPQKSDVSIFNSEVPPEVAESNNVSRNISSVKDQDFIFRKPFDVELTVPSGKLKKFYGVSLPSSTANESSEPLVFEDKIDALKAIKTYKGARFKEFLSKEDALEFAKQCADLIPESPASVQNKQAIKASPESQSVFRQPTSQQTVQVRKAIEKGDFEKFMSAVWSNPLYLINGADSPTILQEGTRYNALHVASKSNQPKMCEEILKIVEDPEFLKLLYPEDTEITRRNRIHHITDLYLNSVDKALLETPLHIAAKFGFLQVVKILHAHPLCDKTKINKYGSLAKEIICTRCSSDCSELKEKIEKAFEGEYYIPVLRNETNVVQPIIGKPCTSERVKQARSPHFSKYDVHEPEYSIKAYAGPMTPSSAKNFYRLWKHPTSPASPIFSSPELYQTDVRFTDLEKGLERVGRKLAAELNVDWKEYWPALDAWVDLTSERGLCMLESYVKKFSNLFQEDKRGNSSDDEHFVTPPSSPVKDISNTLNYKPFHTPPDTPEDSDEELTNEEIFSLQLSKEDISMFRAVENVEIDSISYPHIFKWKQAVQTHLQSCPVKKSISNDSPISSFTVGDRFRSIRRPLF